MNNDPPITKTYEVTKATRKTGNDPVDLEKTGQRDLKTSGDANKTSPRHDTTDDLL